MGGQEANESPNRLYRTLGDQKTWNAETGITGEFGEGGRFNWDLFFNHSVSDLMVTNPNNTDNAKYLAALDAVNTPSGIQCWVEHATAVRRSLSGLRAVEHHRSEWTFGGGV